MKQSTALEHPCRNKYSTGWLAQKVSECGMWNVECKMFWLAGFWNVNFGMWNVTWNVECDFWNVECHFWNVECHFWNVNGKCYFWNVECHFWNVRIFF